jgi:hypothetical protein
MAASITTGCISVPAGPPARVPTSPLYPWHDTQQDKMDKA